MSLRSFNSGLAVGNVWDASVGSGNRSRRASSRKKLVFLYRWAIPAKRPRRHIWRSMVKSISPVVVISLLSGQTLENLTYIYANLSWFSAVSHCVVHMAIHSAMTEAPNISWVPHYALQSGGLAVIELQEIMLQRTDDSGCSGVDSHPLPCLRWCRSIGGWCTWQGHENYREGPNHRLFQTNASV